MAVNDEVKLVLTDLDGTFLDDEAGFDSARFARDFASLAARDIAFGIVTGDQIDWAKQLFGKLADKIWLVAESGAVIEYGGKRYFQSALARPAIFGLIERLDRLRDDLLLILSTATGAKVRASDFKRHADLIGTYYAEVEQLENFSDLEENEKIMKLTIYDPQGKSFELLENLQDFKGDFDLMASEAVWLDVTEIGVDKGSGVRCVQQLLGLDKSATMAFGNAYNDLDMLAEAKYSYAMANAFDEVKAAASAIAPSNNESGVLSVIERELLESNGNKNS